jgi:hypothetical protein
MIAEKTLSVTHSNTSTENTINITNNAESTAEAKSIIFSLLLLYVSSDKTKESTIKALYVRRPIPAFRNNALPL